MTLRSELGRQGEDIACDFLKENGFLILLRNFREKWGEIDIIARDKDKTLVFVEVKTVRSRHGIEDPSDCIESPRFVSAHPRTTNRDRCGNAASGQCGNDCRFNAGGSDVPSEDKKICPHRRTICQ